MIDNHAIRTHHFKNNCLAWTALNHLLPAGLVRDLSHVIVEYVSAGGLRLNDLFEDRPTDGDISLESWAIQPLEPKSTLADYLQRRIRMLAWGNDREVHFQTNDFDKAVGVRAKAIEDAVQLGQADFAAAQQMLSKLHFPEQESVNDLVGAIIVSRPSAASEAPASIVAAVDGRCKSIEMPLAAVVMKHVGDLCADADEWTDALDLYYGTIARLTGYDDAAWAAYTRSLQTVTLQSIAAALRIVKGPESAAAFLSTQLESSQLINAPLLLLNASHDALAASNLGSENPLSTADRRASILFPPLLLQSHDISSALESWIEESFSEANRIFWQLLRRQIALGSASESRVTKAYYARSILSELDNIADRQKIPPAFLLAARLLLESGQSHIVKTIDWSETLIQNYVDRDNVDQVIAHANRNEGSKIERSAVSIELFRGWTEVISPDCAHVAAQMIGAVANAAQNSESSFFGSKNISGRSFEVLHYLAVKRPEFRKDVAPAVASAVVAKLDLGEFWSATAEALKTAHAYLDIVSSEDLVRIISKVLSLLDGIDPAKDFWPLVRPSLDILLSEESQRISKIDLPLGQRIISTVLRFGLNQKTEHARLLFYLHYFDLGSIDDASTLDKLKNVVSDVRSCASTTSASNAVYNINALLLAPAAAGRDGVADALDALIRILKSALSEHPGISFAHAYETLNLLADRQERIAAAISMESGEFRSRLESILSLIVEIWKVAAGRPMLFASFSIPPATKPNPAIIHNWAYASIYFGQSLDQRPVILAALDAAAVQPALRDPIALARATRLAAGDPEDFDSSSIRSENRDTFYAALGQRLVLLRRVMEQPRKDIVQALLDQCLRQGPNGLDAAVFLLVAELKLGSVTVNSEYSNYAKRLENSRELRLALTPMLASLVSEQGASI